MVYGHMAFDVWWCMVYGVSCMEKGKTLVRVCLKAHTPTASGAVVEPRADFPQPPVHGVRRMVYDVRRKVYDVWCMVYDVWCPDKP